MFETAKKGLGAFLGLVAIFVLLFNSFAVEPALKMALSRIQSHSGTEVRFQSASGNLLSGWISLSGVQITREVEGRNAFDLTIGNLTADLALLRIFEPQWRFDTLQMTGVHGRFVTVDRAPKEGGELKGGNLFSIGSVSILQADLEHVNLRDGQEVPTRAEVESLTIQEYRSRWSLYDLLFRSQMKGRLDGRDFELKAWEEEGMHHSHWDLNGLPTPKWGMGWAPPFFTMAGGVVDAKVECTWPLEDPRKIHQAWTMQAKGLHFQETNFEFDLERGGFEGAQSLKDAGFFEALREALIEEVGKVVKGAVGEVGRKVLEFFSNP